MQHQLKTQPSIMILPTWEALEFLLDLSPPIVSREMILERGLWQLREMGHSVKACWENTIQCPGHYFSASIFRHKAQVLWGSSHLPSLIFHGHHYQTTYRSYSHSFKALALLTYFLWCVIAHILSSILVSWMSMWITHPMSSVLLPSTPCLS